MEQQLSELEVDLLLLFYTFSDQYGIVNMPAVREIAKQNLGVVLPPRQIQLTQRHINKLMDIGVVPDVRAVVTTAKTPRKAKRVKKQPPNE